ncbi:MAG: hypothetical protein U0X92_14005 [Anaerolineales bacterium]
MANKNKLFRIIDGVNAPQKDEDVIADAGWNVVLSLYQNLGIEQEGIFGGEVIIAPFDIRVIAGIPKTVYAFNPMLFMCGRWSRWMRCWNVFALNCVRSDA